MTAIMSLSETKRMLLDKYLRRDIPPQVAASRCIVPRPSGEPAPLSLSQEQLVFRERNTPCIPRLYNECVTLRMAGPLDISALERSFTEIIRRHEIWRTSYQIKDGGLIQFVRHVPDEIWPPVIDLRDFSAAMQEEEVKKIIGEIVSQPFDLENGPLLQARLIRMGDFEHRLYLIMHLSIVDGVSAYQIFPLELALLYSANCSGQSSPLPRLAVQFGDYAFWQRQWLQTEELAKQLDYWRTQLADFPALRWPRDRPLIRKQTFRGAIYAFALPKAVGDAAKAVSQQEGVTLFVLLLATFVALLNRYTQQDDIVVGTPSPAGRKRPEVEKLLGYFLNPVALRFDLTGDITFRELLRQAQRLTFEAMSNDDVPIELLAGELKQSAERCRNTLFTVAISLQPPMPPLGLEWSVTSMDINSGGAPWDFYIAFIDRPSGITGRVQYNPDLFETGTIARMLQHFQQLLETVSTNPMKRLSTAPMLTP